MLLQQFITKYSIIVSCEILPKMIKVIQINVTPYILWIFHCANIPHTLSLSLHQSHLLGRSSFGLQKKVFGPLVSLLVNLGDRASPQAKTLLDHCSSKSTTLCNAPCETFAPCRLSRFFFQEVARSRPASLLFPLQFNLTGDELVVKRTERWIYLALAPL